MWASGVVLFATLFSTIRRHDEKPRSMLIASLDATDLGNLLVEKGAAGHALSDCADGWPCAGGCAGGYFSWHRQGLAVASCTGIAGISVLGRLWIPQPQSFF